MRQRSNLRAAATGRVQAHETATEVVLLEQDFPFGMCGNSHLNRERVRALLEKILIVEDELHARTGLTELVESWGYRADSASDGAAGLERVQQWSPDLVITDLKMPRMDGMELLRRVADLGQGTCVVVLTAQGSIESAVEAMRQGAWDYLPKPVDPSRLRAILASAGRQRAAVDQPHHAPAQVTGRLEQMIGTTPDMQAIFKLIARVAGTNVSVLVTGETGTGKELVARALHQLSPRRHKPFLAVNCAAMPDTLIESELFGHEKGAFTGAQERRAGCFELAEGGTLLLDEIGDMPAPTQSKLLRVLEERTLRRLGSRTETPVDVRVVAATNKDPQAAIAAGQLRSDLFYRLNVFSIRMPPLRAHADDIVPIAQQMIADMNARHQCRVTGISAPLAHRLKLHHWPGNVRELRNTIERAVIVAASGQLQEDDLPTDFGQAPAQARASHDGAVHLDVGTTVDEAERQLILKTLQATSNNKTHAAEILGITTRTLQNKLKEYARLTAATSEVL